MEPADEEVGTNALTMNRRAVLGGVAATAVLSSSVGRQRSAAAESKFDTIRQRRVENLIGGDFDPTADPYADRVHSLSQEAAKFHDALKTDDDRSGLWSDLPISESKSGNVSDSYDRLLTLAKSWRTKGTDQHAKKSLVDDLTDGLKFLHKHGYNKHLSEKGNWWHWEIGNPKSLTDLCCLLYDKISSDELDDYMATIEHFVPDPNRRGIYPSVIETGANRTDKAQICVLRGALAADADVIKQGRDAVSDRDGDGKNSVFTYVTKGDGFYKDGSFIQHEDLPYVGTYGNVTLSGVATLFQLLGDSDWDITDPDRDVILDAVEQSFRPFIVNGHMMDTVRGRAVSREDERDYDDGFGTISSILLLAEGVDKKYADRFRSLAKGWIKRCRDASYVKQASIPELRRAVSVLDDDSVSIADEPSGHAQFPAQDRAVHRGDGWAFTVSISSSRIGRYEWGNDENNLGWYQGDGMTYLYRDDDIDHYSDSYWPTVDPYLMPGTTVSDVSRSSGEGDGTGIPSASKSWAGGVSVASRFGAIGMDHHNSDSHVAAKKSWFCLDDVVVALGAAISGSGGHRVRTIVENRNRHQHHHDDVQVNGSSASDDGDVTFDHPHWLSASRLGLIGFPAGGRLVLRQGDRTGNWHKINAGGPDEAITRRYLSIWLDHGIDPKNERYVYLISPNATSAGHAHRAMSRIRILANTGTAQAIEDHSSGVWLGNFFKAGRAGRVQTDGPASIVVHRNRGRTTVAISDPSRTGDTLTASLAGISSRRVISADDDLEVLQKHRLKLRAKPQAGKPLHVVLED